VFLGSSFAFLVGIRLITDPTSGIFAASPVRLIDAAGNYLVDAAGNYEYGVHISQAMSGLAAGSIISNIDYRNATLAYATGGILVAGFVYFILALIVKLVGVKKVMKAMPPVVTGPIVILIGVMLAPFAIDMSSNNLPLALISLGIVIVAAIWGRGMAKVVPLVLGMLGGYGVALIMNAVGISNPDGSAIFNFAQVAEASIVGMPPFMLPRFNIIAIMIMIPFAFATIAEHIADMVILSNLCEEDFTKKPGLHRTLVGDGLATCFSGLIGAPATTTYSENVGVVVLTKIQDAKVVMLAAMYAVILGFLPIFAQIVYTIPTAIVGGVSFILYGMIAAVGIRSLVENQVDIGKTKNLVIVAVILVTGLGLRFGPTITVTLGNIDLPIDRLGVAIAAILGIVLNFILPNEKEDKPVVVGLETGGTVALEEEE
jgi:uracil permease